VGSPGLSSAKLVTRKNRFCSNMPVAMDEMTLRDLVSEPRVIPSASGWKGSSCQQPGRREDVLIVALDDPRGSQGKWPAVAAESPPAPQPPGRAPGLDVAVG